MSQVAIVTCREGIAVASESLVSCDHGPLDEWIPKIHPLGPRLIFAAVGNATMPDPRIDRDWPGLAHHLDTLTAGEQIEGDPVDIAERIGQFVTDILGWLSERPRGGEGMAVAMWRVEYVVAGYAPGSDVGVVSGWEAGPGGAGEFRQLTTEQRVGRLALGAYSEWPRVRRRIRPLRREAGAAEEPYTLEQASESARRVVRLACEEFPSWCGGPQQRLTVTPGEGVRWLERLEAE